MSTQRGQLTNVAQERALLVQVVVGRAGRETARDSLEELERLADTAGAVVVGTISQNRDAPNPKYFVGSGKIDEIKLVCEKTGANLVIFDNDLSPVQVNNLDVGIGVKVIDRTEVILQIFARRARSAEAQIQVELAQLQYLVSRLPVSEKQARFTGGIGMKGPGESPLKLRNAPMRARIQDLKAKLDKIQDRRDRTRARRKWPTVSLVGYTNAGKSTLLNSLAEAGAYVDDRLFATLDTKSRLIHLPAKIKMDDTEAVPPKGMDVLVTDTVGFIRHLPHGLIASFRSTLEEVAQADLLLHVADTGHPYVTEHCEVVFDTLKEIGAHEVKSLMVFNKSDRPEAQAALPGLMKLFPDAIAISALREDGLDLLKKRMAEMMKEGLRG
jgi:GTP-binding protein HflX